MAEVASGAITSLLGVIRDEALLLSAVRGDVQFIKEEMESMNCFLAHLARTAPPDGEHDEQVCGWMNQVRVLAQDCNNCIGIYRYYSNPDIHLASNGLRRYLKWLPWFARKMAAQHDAALRLRELKDRSRDVGERRLRYGVEVPVKAVGLSSVVTLDVDEDEDDGNQAETGLRLRAVFELPSLDNYFSQKLVDWMKEAKKQKKKQMPSTIAIVARTTDDADKLADAALAVAKDHFKSYFLVHTSVSLFRFTFFAQINLDVLSNILHEIQLHGEKFRPQQEGTSAGQPEVEEHVPVPPQSQSGRGHRGRHTKMLNVLKEIKENMKEMKVEDSLEEIRSKIEAIKGEGLEQDLELVKYYGDALEVQSLFILHCALRRLKNNSDNAAIKQDQSSPDIILEKTRTMLKEHMERDDAEKRRLISSLHMNQYVNILNDVFPTISKQPQAEEKAALAAKQAANTSTSNTTSLGGDLIREIVDKVKLELQQELQEYKTDTEQATRKQGARGQQIPEAVIEETNNKLKKIQLKIEQQLMITRMLDKIKDHLKDDERTLIIIKTSTFRLQGWEETITALNLLGCIAGVVMVNTTKSYERAEIYCSPPWKPINYSHSGQYYDRVLQLTSQKTNVDTKFFLDILEGCEPHGEFWMKIFAHALYSNPNRSNEELRKLHSSLQISPGSSASIPMKMFKFSYRDLPKEFRSCLLYLAIFPSECNIRRSTLLGRWVVEGLITKEDWPSSVRQANRCFDLLIERCLVNPGDIGATGNIKSCKVSDRVHQLITKIARSQQIVDTRLSHHLARHFSIFNDLHLCGLDSIDNFFKQLISQKSQLSMIKVLDLEGCQCSFKENPYYLEVICNKLLLLKYLSLRGTNITKLPNELNKLYELEVLDIRQTSLPAPATKHIVLLKLKRLLAGHRGTMTSSIVGAQNFSSVRIPENIGKMENMEVLSNVKAQDDQEFKYIGRLWRLRKFGVVILDKKSHVKPFLEAISNLHECLRSLSITLLPTTKCSVELPELENSPKHLESLSINGSVEKLLPLLARGVNQKLGKVTLSNTLLNKVNLKVIAKLQNLCRVELRNIACTDDEDTFIFKRNEFPNLRYFLVEGFHKQGSKLTKIIFEDGATGKLENLCRVELRNIACTDDEDTFIFKRNEFPNLRYFLVEGFHKQGSKLTKIIFEDGATGKLEKIVLSQTCIESICAVKKLPEMREIEFNGGSVPNGMQEFITTHTNQQRGFVFKQNNSGHQGEALGNEQEKDDGARRFFCC